MISRRIDKSAFTCKIYHKIMDMILNKCSFSETLNALESNIQNLLDGNVSITDLTIRKTLRENYMSDKYYLKIFSDNLKKNGKIINPGDIVNYVIIQDSTTHGLGNKMRLVDDYLLNEGTNDAEVIDFNYYIKKELMRPIKQLFDIAFPNTNFVFPYKSSKRNHLSL